MMQKTSMISKTTRILAAAVATVALAGSAQAQKVIPLTAIDGYPAKALWVKTFLKYFVPAVNAELAKTNNYKIK